MKEIIFEDVCKTYHKTNVIENLNLTIQPGERLILLGASGCGKSTTLRMIGGLEEITSGNLYMDGQRINDVASGKRNVSMVFQNYALFPHMTVAENIIYGLKVQKLAQDQVKERLQSALSMLELNGLEERKPKDLSGGQRQRVALARAIVKRSDVLLLDEPLSNLDAQLRVHARKELVKIHQAYHQTFVYVTHDQVEAMTVGDRIALMDKGKLQMVDTPHNVYHKPANVFAAKFIGSPSTNIFAVQYEDRSIQIGSQKITLPNSWNDYVGKKGCAEFYLGIRPEHIQLETEQGENSFSGTVKYIEDYGNRCGVYFTIGDEEVVAIQDQVALKPGQPVWFKLNFNKIHMFDKQTTVNIGYPEV